MNEDRDKFEQWYARERDCDLSWIQNQRTPETYSGIQSVNLRTAWAAWRAGQAALTKAAEEAGE